MSEKSKSRVLKALKVSLKPLARALISVGISYNEFADAGKAAYVEVAAKDFGIRGRRTNNSRIAIITGLSRKEVKRLVDGAEANGGHDFVRESPASVVLHNWRVDPRYQTEDGDPRDLDYEGDGLSFTGLVATYAGDIPPGALRAELKRIGAIEEPKKGVLKMLRPYFVPRDSLDGLVVSLEAVTTASFSTIAFNSDPRRNGAARFHRVASVDGINSKFHSEIEKHASEQLMGFALEFCDYLGEFERRQEVDDIEPSDSQIGVGLFFYTLGSSETS